MPKMSNWFSKIFGGESRQNADTAQSSGQTVVNNEVKPAETQTQPENVENHQ